MSVKGMPADANVRLREAVEQLVTAAGNRAAAGKALGVSYGYLSDFLDGKRGGGWKLLVAVGRASPRALLHVLGLPDIITTHGKELDAIEAVGLLPAGTQDDGAGLDLLPPDVSAKVEETARGILRKRGWSDDEISAGKNRATLLIEEDAADPIAVADAWEIPLRGRHLSQP